MDLWVSSNDSQMQFYYHRPNQNHQLGDGHWPFGHLWLLIDSASVQNYQVTLWLLIKSGLLSGHFRWLLDNELLTAKKSNKSYDSLSVCPGALCITLSGTGGEMLQVRERLREVSCRYVAWRCSNSCKCLKWSPRIEAGRGSTKGSCACWKYAVSWCAPKRSSFLREPVSSIYLSGQANFRVPMSCIVWRMLCFGCPGQGIHGYSVCPGVPYTLLVPSSKNIHQFLHPESSSSFCWDHLQPDFILSANGGSDHHHWCLPPTTPWLHASGVTFFHAVRSNASAAR